MITAKTLNSIMLQLFLLTFSFGVDSVASIPFSQSANEIFVVYATGLGEPITINETMAKKPSIEEYKKARYSFCEAEKSRSLGWKLQLDERELLANEIIMKVKMQDMENGFANPQKFAPSKHIFEVLDQIKESNLFKLLRKMPKGGALHAHDTALASTDYVVSLTYRPHLWQCYNPETSNIAFIFSREQPAVSEGCEWTLVSEEREKQGKQKYDAEIRKYFTLYTKNPETEYTDINHVWKCFIDIFIRITPLLTYVPVWKEYYKTALKEFYEDNVQYLEFRGTLPDLYDLDGKTYSNGDVVQVYVDALQEFKRENPGFIGSKFIYAPNRKVDDTTFAEYMKNILELQARFPQYVVGFDLVSQEDGGRPLIDFAEPLLALPPNVNFFFHAGETNWNGMSSDENLLDAVLLGTKRIGHGYGVLKHPKVLEAIKEKGIAIELNPISNQVLKLVSDNRNHPGSFLFSDDYPVVVSSDDPSFWEATPLSHDFYIAFLGIASAHGDLKTLKQLAINSLVYSSLNVAEKEIGFAKWEAKWKEYIEWIIAQRSNVL